MNKTIDEIYELVKKKYKSASTAYNFEWRRKYPNIKKLNELKGNMDAYYDVCILIKTSNVLSGGDDNDM